MQVGQDVSIAFTLAYDFQACRKVWDAFYINLPGGIRGVATDKSGNFVVAGYDGLGTEYILRHKASGEIPDVWTFTGEESAQITPGGINFAFNDEWIVTLSPFIYKFFRHDPLPEDPARDFLNSKFMSFHS